MLLHGKLTLFRQSKTIHLNSFTEQWKVTSPWTETVCSLLKSFRKLLPEFCRSITTPINMLTLCLLNNIPRLLWTSKSSRKHSPLRFTNNSSRNPIKNRFASHLVQFGNNWKSEEVYNLPDNKTMSIGTIINKPSKLSTQPGTKVQFHIFGFTLSCAFHVTASVILLI